MKRIFFVEDDLSLVNGLSYAIKKQGYEMEVARTSLEAETLWRNGPYDLVILDVSLPDGSGYDLCKKIRQTSKVPIIFLTAAVLEPGEISHSEPGEISHSEPGENRQFWPNENRQLLFS